MQSKLLLNKIIFSTPNTYTLVTVDILTVRSLVGEVPDVAVALQAAVVVASSLAALAVASVVIVAVTGVVVG